MYIIYKWLSLCLQASLNFLMFLLPKSLQLYRCFHFLYVYMFFHLCDIPNECMVKHIIAIFWTFINLALLGLILWPIKELKCFAIFDLSWFYPAPNLNVSKAPMLVTNLGIGLAVFLGKGLKRTKRALPSFSFCILSKAVPHTAE